jgi:asparagine synthetase B (glutamine-hydrolysing)
MIMQSTVLGYCAPLSLPLDAAVASRQTFCDRATAFGLSVSFISDRHAVATTGCAPIAPRAVHGRWRVIHFDGLLHKRASLLMYGVKPDVMSDGEALEHLLNEHGPSSLAWPIGDWAVAAVAADGVLLACDYFGNRQLFYHLDRDGALTWSDQYWVLAEVTGQGDALDKVYFAGLLYFMSPPDRTPFADIRAIPAGYVGILGEAGLDVRPFWAPQKHRIQLADPREYGQAYYELLRDGVRERLRAPGRKWVEISGGVDSALVAACVSSCVREDSGLGPVEAVHYVTDRPESAGDTRRAREAAAQFGLPLRTFSHEELLRDSTTASIEDPFEPFGAFRESTRLAHQEGVTTLLSGRLGDLVTGNREPEPGLLLDLGWQLGVRQALRAIFEWAVFSETPVWFLLSRLAHDRIFSTRETKLLATFTEHTRDKSAAKGSGRTPATALESALENAIAAWGDFLGWSGRDALDYADVWWWFAIHTMRLSGSYRALWGGQACARTYALNHRPLIEFVVACPWTVFLAPSRPRRLVHEQLGQLLPRSLAGNILKSDTSTWRIVPFRHLWSSTFATSHSSHVRVVETGLFTPEELTALGAGLRGSRGTMAVFPRVVQTELWLRTRPRQLGFADPTAKGGENHALRKA